MRDPDGGHQVEAKKREVDEVVAGQSFVAQVRVNETQTAEATPARSQTPELGQHELGRIADEDVLDLAATGDQHADLALNFARDGAELGGHFRGSHLFGKRAPTKETFEGFDFARFEARDVTGHCIQRKLTT
jgi:hypothetical protein